MRAVPSQPGPMGYGLLLALFGAGELIGGLAAGGLGRFAPPSGHCPADADSPGYYPLPPFPCSGTSRQSASFSCFAGVLNGLINVLYFTLIEEYNPAHLMGRIWGVVMFATFGLYPISVNPRGPGD